MESARFIIRRVKCQRTKQHPDVESCINALNKDINNALSDISLKIDPTGAISLSFNCTQNEEQTPVPASMYYSIEYCGELAVKNKNGEYELRVICNVKPSDIYDTKTVLKQVLGKISFYKVSIAKLIT